MSTSRTKKSAIESAIEIAGDQILTAAFSGFLFGTLVGLKNVAKADNGLAQLPQVQAGMVARRALEFSAFGALFVGSSEAVNIFRTITSKQNKIEYNPKAQQRYNYGIGGALTGISAALFHSIDLGLFRNTTTNNTAHTYRDTAVQQNAKHPTTGSFLKNTAFAISKQAVVIGVCGFAYGFASEQLEVLEEMITKVDDKWK